MKLLKFILIFASLLVPIATVQAVPAESEKPTLHDVLVFLSQDWTNEQEYTSWHACEAFAHDLQMNGALHGFDFYRVRVDFSGGDGHIYNAIDTADYGTVYVEPQDDLPYETPFVGGYMCYNDKGWDMNHTGNVKCVEDANFIITRILEFH